MAALLSSAVQGISDQISCSLPGPLTPVRSGPTLSRDEALTEVARSAFSPDGHTLAIAQDNGTVQLWETDASRAINRICHATGSTLTRQQWQQHIPELPYDPPCP
jgi:WD40 repeat protein